MGMRDLQKMDSESSHYNDSKFIVQLLRDNISVSIAGSVWLF